MKKLVTIGKFFPQESTNATIAPGNFDTDGKSYLRFRALNGWINILELQLEGKKKMDMLKKYYRSRYATFLKTI